jgi:parallel beta-helix repeat protein
MADTASLIEAGVFDYGVKFENEIHDIVIQGIVLEKYTGAGTYSAYPVWNLDIRDNVYRNMDGSGIRLDGIPTHCTISSNRMDRINSRAISLMRAVDCTVTGNQISHTGLIRGYGLSGVNGASAISMPNLETQVQSEPFAHNNLIQFNTIDSCGYVGIRVDGHDNTIINNVISNCMLTLNDGAGIYCFARQTGVTFKNTIQNNIVINIIGDNTGTPGNSLIAKGIYLDNYSHENMVEGNTIINARSAGILVNDGSNRNKILNNNLFGNNAGISFAEWRSVGQNYGNEVKGNSVICAKASQKAIDLINHISSEMKPAIFENNFYCNFYDQYFFRILTNHKIYRNTSEMSFDVWKDRTRQDGTSKSLNPGDLVKYPGGAILLSNEGKIEKEYSIKEKKYYYIDGKRAGESITLEPFRSVILLVE